MGKSAVSNFKVTGVKDLIDTSELNNSPISHKIDGYYCEYIIINYTKYPIYVIDHNNEITEIKPSIAHSPKYQAGVGIQQRIVNDGRPSKDRFVDLPAGTAFQYFIPETVLEQDAFYSHVTNLVICTGNRLDSVQHPQCTSLYKCLDSVKSDMERKLNHPQIHVFVNDKEVRYPTLYFHIFNHTMKVKVTNYKSEPDLCLVVFNMDDVDHTYMDSVSIPITDIMDGKGKVASGNNDFYMGFDLQEVLLRYEQDVALNRDKIPSAQIDTLIKERFKKELDYNTQQLEQKNTEYKNNIGKLNDIIAQQKHEIGQLKRDFELQRDTNVTLQNQIELMEKERDRANDKAIRASKERESQYGVEKAEVGYYSTVAKSLPVIITAAVAIIALLIGKNSK